jgi:hypothetical protein
VGCLIWRMGKCRAAVRGGASSPAMATGDGAPGRVWTGLCGGAGPESSRGGWRR